MRNFIITSLYSIVIGIALTLVFSKVDGIAAIVPSSLKLCVAPSDNVVARALCRSNEKEFTVPATHGAGTVAFLEASGNGDAGYLLKTDGTVWYYAAGPSDPDTNFHRQSAIYDPPVPVSDIIDWRMITFITSNGDVWSLQPGNLQSEWVNLGQP